MSPTIQQVHTQSALSTLSIAYRQDRPAVSDLIFPRVNVAKMADSYYVWTKADMWRPEAKKRAPGTLFARMGLTLSTDQYRVEQYALEYELPDEVIANADAGIELEETAAMTLVDQLSLIKDIRFAADFFTSSSGWTAGTVSTAWDTVATGTPVTNIVAGARSIRQALGATTGHRLIGLGGEKIRDAFLTSTQIRERSQYVKEGTLSAIEASLAAVLGLDEIIFDGRMYNTKPEKATASYSAIFDRGFLVVAVPRGPGLMTASAGYTFAWDEGGRGDMYNETYRDEPKKQDVLRAITYFDQKQTGAELGVYFNNAVS